MSSFQAARTAISLLLLSVAGLPGAGFANGSSEVNPPSPTAPAPAPQPDPLERFAGAYIGGGLLAAGNGDDRVGLAFPPNLPGNAGKLVMQGAMGELFLGYRVPATDSEDDGPPLLLGIELLLQAGRVDDSDAARGVDSFSRVERLAALRAQVATPLRDDILFYGFYGLVRAEVDYAVRGVFQGERINIAEQYASRGTTFGVGLEYILARSWSLRGELGVTNLEITELTGARGEVTEATPSWTSLSIAAVYRF